MREGERREGGGYLQSNGSETSKQVLSPERLLLLNGNKDSEERARKEGRKEGGGKEVREGGRREEPGGLRRNTSVFGESDVLR